jgi:SGNH hydrolase-like domain, acetyltransferase AlgX
MPGGDRERDVSGEAEDPSRFVLRGRDGWLFLRNDTNDSLGQHEGRVRLDQASVGAWQQLLEGRVALERDLGIPWICAIAPDKEALYPEYLPASVSPVRERPVHEVLRLASEAGADVHYLLDDLAADKDWGELYSRTDTHWNHRGSYSAHVAICRRLALRGIDAPAFERDRLLWVEEDAAQDLGSKLDPPQLSPLVVAQVPWGKGVMVADNRVRKHGRIAIFEGEDASLPSCVLFGESFAYYLLDFLKESFRRLVFVHSSAVIPEIVRAERPDAVVSVPVERFLIHPPDDLDAMTRFKTMIRAKVEAGAIFEIEDELTPALEPGGIPAAWLDAAPVE